jgi:hypothetical protein
MRIAVLPLHVRSPTLRRCAGPVMQPIAAGVMAMAHRVNDA